MAVPYVIAHGLVPLVVADMEVVISVQRRYVEKLALMFFYVHFISYLCTILREWGKVLTKW